MPILHEERHAVGRARAAVGDDDRRLRVDQQLRDVGERGRIGIAHHAARADKFAIGQHHAAGSAAFNDNLRDRCTIAKDHAVRAAKRFERAGQAMHATVD